MSKISLFLAKVNNYPGNINWKEIMDKDYQKELTEKLVSMFEEVYGTTLLTWRECEDDEGFAEIPGTILAKDGKEYVALLSINVEDSGEHYGTTLFHPKYGFLDQENFSEKLSKEDIENIIPYKYRLLATLPRDHHGLHQY